MVLSIILLSVAAIFIVAFLYFRINISKAREDENVRLYKRYYVMICDDINSSFWQHVYQGAADAAESMDAYVELFGHGLNEDYSPEELMEMAISSKVDGIMVLGNEEDEMTALIDRSADLGIPVVTMYSDSPSSKRCSFVGVSAFNIGREYGRQIVNARNEKLRIGAGTEDADQDSAEPVAVTIFFDDNNRLYDQSVILSGINDALSREAADAEFLIRTVAVDNSNPFSVEESMRDVFMDEEVPDILVCLSELDTTCAYQAAIDHNMVGNVYILGYYDSEKILNALSRNVLYSTLAVDTSEMGRYCVEALNEYVEMGNTSQYFSTDVTIIDRGNVSSYLNSGGEAYE